MTRPLSLFTCVLALAALTTVGCQQPQAAMEDRAKPERPVELDRFDMFIGEWEFTTDSRPTDSEETSTGTGIDTYRWACDRRVMIDHWKGTHEHGSFEGLMIWTWDPPSRKYRVHAFYDSGAVGSATGTYDEESNRWRFKGKSKNPLTGETKVHEGVLTFRDADTVVFEGSAWDGWKLKKLTESKGELRRR